MNNSSWHGFSPGERVATDTIIATCEQRIRDGHISSVAEKQGYLDVMRESGHDSLTYTPQSSRWGSSPFNLNNWRTSDGQRITPKTAA